MPTECVEYNPLQRSLADAIIRMQPMDEIRILLACGAKVNEPVTQGLRALHYAVWQRNIPAVELLLVRGADINATDEVGYSALHLAAEHGFYDLAKVLLKAGAKVDYREDTNELFPRTTLCDEPLRLALKNKFYDIARLLLEFGADPNKRYFFGAEINLAADFESLELLLNYGANTEIRDRSGLTPLMRLVRQNIELEQVLLLLSYEADVNAMADNRNDYRTVLHYGVLSANPELVNLLIKQGAKVNNSLPEAASPLDLAIMNGMPEMVKLLLNAGADINRCSPLHGTPLHVACSNRIRHRLEIMKILFSHGADPNMKVYGEMSATEILRPPLPELLSSNEDISINEVQLLLKYGARVVMKTQYRDPEGLLNCLMNIIEQPEILEILVGAAEEFDTCMIRRNSHLSAEQRKMLLEKATKPLSLKSQTRAFYRKLFGKRLPETVPQLFIPLTLRRYLVYEHS